MAVYSAGPSPPAHGKHTNLILACGRRGSRIFMFSGTPCSPAIAPRPAPSLVGLTAAAHMSFKKGLYLLNNLQNARKMNNLQIQPSTDRREFSTEASSHSFLLWCLGILRMIFPFYSYPKSRGKVSTIAYRSCMTGPNTNTTIMYMTVLAAVTGFRVRKTQFSNFVLCNLF